jgi:phage baseplate assembly protein W
MKSRRIGAFARVDDAIREGLKALGYYEPTIDLISVRRRKGASGADRQSHAR